jgi:hypothetical protein
MSELTTFILLFYLAITNPFIRIITSDTHVYLCLRFYKTTIEDDGDMLDHIMVKNFKLFRYGFGDKH